MIYTPSADYHGGDSFSYTVTSNGTTETTTVDVTVTAVADIVSDTATTVEDTAVNILVQANDSFENTGHTITSVTQGTHGAVTIHDNGTAGDTTDDYVIYTPSADYHGGDSFSYTVTSNGTTETTTVDVTVTAVADIVSDTVTTVEDTAVNILVQANDSFENTGHTITSVTQGTHGAVTIHDNGTAGDTTDDYVIYTPSADYHGGDSFSYTVTSNGTTETTTVDVTVTAVADIVSDTATTAEDTAKTITVLANDTFEGTPVVTDKSDGEHGTVVIHGDNTLTYTPSSDYFGSDRFTYTVTSGGVIETATVDVTITAVNDVPAFTKGSDVNPLGDGVQKSIVGWASDMSRPRERVVAGRQFHCHHREYGIVCSSTDDRAQWHADFYTQSGNCWYRLDDRDCADSRRRRQFDRR